MGLDYGAPNIYGMWWVFMMILWIWQTGRERAARPALMFNVPEIGGGHFPYWGSTDTSHRALCLGGGGIFATSPSPASQMKKSDREWRTLCGKCGLASSRAEGRPAIVLCSMLLLSQQE